MNSGTFRPPCSLESLAAGEKLRMRSRIPKVAVSFPTRSEKGNFVLTLRNKPVVFSY